MANEIVTKPSYGVRLVGENGAALRSQLLFHDDLEQKLNTYLLGDRLRLPEYASADLPDATTATGLVFVTDLGLPAFSDGTNWYRFTAGAVI